MEAVREAWTDGRLDDLNQKVERIDQRVDEMNHEMHSEFRAVRGEMNARFDSLQNQMLAMSRTMIGGFVTLLATMLATQL
jgi:DNA anti-recombination protein RmuC